MSRGKSHSPEIREQAFTLFADDLTNAEAARKLGISESTTWEWRKQWAGTEAFENLRPARRSERARGDALPVYQGLQGVAEIRIHGALGSCHPKGMFRCGLAGIKEILDSRPCFWGFRSDGLSYRRELDRLEKTSVKQAGDGSKMIPPGDARNLSIALCS